MADITLTTGERDLLREKLCAYCEQNFDFELEQFDAEFFVAGIEEAIRTHVAYSERIQEEMDLKKVY